MKNSDYIKCILSIITFIIISDDEVNETHSFITNSSTNMTAILGKHGFGVISFTQHISLGTKLWENSPTEFFSDHERVISFLWKNSKSIMNDRNMTVINK